MAYFLRAKSQFQCKMGPGFIHNFQEMTYLKPTFCEHCAGFVSMILILAYLKNNFYPLMDMGWNWLHTLLKSLGQIISHGILKYKTLLML